MTQKLKARLAAGEFIVARTDTRTSLDVDVAIARGKAFAKAGADIVFVEAPESEAEFERVGQALAGEAWLFANMVPSGKSPVASAENLKRNGYTIVIYPTAAMNVACAALEQAYRYLEQRGSTAGSPVTNWAMDESNAEQMANRRDGVGHVPLRTPGCHAGCNQREGRALGGRCS